MLYRRFPKIANKEFSILALSLAGNRADGKRVTVAADLPRAEELLRAAAGRGINLVWAGSSGADAAVIGALLETTGLSETVIRILEYTGKTAEGLTAFLAEAGARGREFLLVRSESARDAENLKTAGVFDAAERARKGGTIAWAGFSTTCENRAILAALEAFSSADFWATDYSYRCDDVAEAIGKAAQNELSFISLDPLSSGTLDPVPPEVHEIFRNAPVPRSHDEWALRAVWESQDLVSAMIAPASPEDLLRKTIFAEGGRANSLPSRELAVIAEAAKCLNAGVNKEKRAETEEFRPTH